jgi:hypothetical protein
MDGRLEQPATDNREVCAAAPTGARLASRPDSASSSSHGREGHLSEREAWLLKERQCWHAVQDRGPKIGRVDVAGVHRSQSDVRDSDDIYAVEVKEAKSGAFLNGAGQAKAYTVMADYAYFARPSPFSAKETLIAERLGIGLLELRRRKTLTSAWAVHIALDAPRSNTDEGLKEELLAAMRCGSCRGCGRVFRTDQKLDELGQVQELTGHFGGITKVLQRSGTLQAAAQQGKALAWYVEPSPDDDRLYVYNRRYLCHTCVRELSKALRA